MQMKFVAFMLYAALSVCFVTMPTPGFAEPNEEAFLALFHAADSKLQAKEPEEALSLFRRARHIRNTPKLEINIAICLYDLERFDAALSALESALLFENLDDDVRKRADALHTKVTASLKIPSGTNFRVLWEGPGSKFAIVPVPGDLM